jgi:hypothetical protein
MANEVLVTEPMMLAMITASGVMAGRLQSMLGGV